MSDYRRGSGVWKIPPIIGLEPFGTLAKFSKRGARFDHVGQGRQLPVTQERTSNFVLL